MKVHIEIFLIVICLWLLSGNSIAQINLVLNPSFEQLKGCPPTQYLADSLKYWDWINNACNSVPNHQCNPLIYSISTSCNLPNNFSGYQAPRTGSNYIGACSIRSPYPAISNRRDYLKGRLSSTLQAGKNYCLTFYYVTGKNIEFATNRYGAYVDNGTVGMYDCCKDMPVIPQVQNNPAVFMTDTAHWVKLQGSFTAIGNENTITLGNFVDSATIQFQVFNINGVHAPFYLIDDVSLIQMDLPAYAGRDTSLCNGDSTYLGRQSEVGLDDDCTWYVLGNTTPIDTIAGLSVKPNVTTSYVVEQNICGTITYDTVTVTIKPKLKGNVNLTATSQNICPNISTQLQATTSNNTGLQWNWQPSNITSDPSISNPTANPTINTTYTLITTTNSTSIYCGTDTSKIFIHVINLLNVNAGRDTAICAGMSANIGSNANLCTWCTYNWSPATGINQPHAANTTATLLSNIISQTYILAQTDSCQTTTDNVTIFSKDCTFDSVVISIPNIFTPNGDGKNDIWSMIVSNGLEIFNIQTTIYNRWGKKVFESTNIHQDWNGHNLYEGSLCSPDTYFYVVSYTDGNTNQNKTLKGFIQLIW